MAPVEMSKAAVVDLVCQALARNDQAAASAVAKEQYAFHPGQNPGRRYTELQMTRVFVRDGFIDRYSGEKLIFPGTLRLLSILMPEEFPAHPNWKMSATHLAFWELFPTIDHVIPVARGGTDDETNWVTTSMLKYSAKANWKLDELGWVLQPPGDVEVWDGLMRWFVDYTASHPDVAETGYTKRWRSAAVRVLSRSASVE